MNIYNYFVETKAGLTFHFYSSDVKEVESKLNSMKSFTEGDFWILDACNNEEVLSFYDTYEKDDSFVKIPKEEVVRFFSIAGSPPKKLNTLKAKNIFNFLKK